MNDLSQIRFRATSIGRLMGYPGGKSNKEKYDETYALIIDTETKLFKMMDKQCKTAIKRTERIEELQIRLAELEPIIDDEELSHTCKRYLDRVYFNLKYHKKSISDHFRPKQLAKGTISEQQSLDLIRELDAIDYSRNKQKLTNDYISGTPDLFIGESINNAQYVIDAKTSWDAGTFYKNLTTQLKVDYAWQIQAYLWLTGANSGEVSFCLVNTPQKLIDEEKEYLFRRMGVKSKRDPAYKRAVERLTRDLTFDDIPKQERRIRFVANRDEALIKRIGKRIDACRLYLIELDKKFGDLFYHKPEIDTL